MGGHDDFEFMDFDDLAVTGRPRTTDSAQARRGPVGRGGLRGRAAFQIEYFPIGYGSGFDPETALDEHLRSPYVEFENSFLYPRNQGADMHHAVDLLGPVGLPIFATTGGRVITEWRYRGEIRPGANRTEDEQSGHGGNFVRMLDASGYVHYYSHLRDFPLVEPGEPLTAGQLLGYLGRSGTTTPHLHYQVRAPVRVRGRMLGARGVGELLPGVQYEDDEARPPSYSTRGGGPVNPFDELVRLCLELGGEPIGRGTRHRLNP